jgi:nitrogen fixation protein FixH
VGLAITCFGHKVELEAKDYYARELKFQDQMDAEKNANLLDIAIDYRVNNKSVELVFPKEVLHTDFKGSVVFFRPSDSSLDKTISLQPDEAGKQFIQDPAFVKGVYKMQIAFTSGGKPYYKESIINFK